MSSRRDPSQSISSLESLFNEKHEQYNHSIQALKSMLKRDSIKDLVFWPLGVACIHIEFSAGVTSSPPTSENGSRCPYCWNNSVWLRTRLREGKAYRALQVAGKVPQGSARLCLLFCRLLPRLTKVVGVCLYIEGTAP
jgi:hypothetical protein